MKRFEALLERLLKGSIGRLSINAINEQMLRERLLLFEIAVRTKPTASVDG